MIELLKIAHLIMVAMASGLTLAQYMTLRASVGRESEAGLDLARRTIADVSTFAVGFVWFSGALLFWAHTDAQRADINAWFYAKLVFVVLFTLAHAIQRATSARMRTGGDRVAARRSSERWTSIAWLMSLLAICLAVISFG